MQNFFVKLSKFMRYNAFLPHVPSFCFYIKEFWSEPDVRDLWAKQILLKKLSDSEMMNKKSEAETLYCLHKHLDLASVFQKE